MTQLTQILDVSNNTASYNNMQVWEATIVLYSKQSDLFSKITILMAS